MRLTSSPMLPYAVSLVDASYNISLTYARKTPPLPLQVPALQFARRALLIRVPTRQAILKAVAMQVREALDRVDMEPRSRSSNMEK